MCGSVFLLLTAAFFMKPLGDDEFDSATRQNPPVYAPEARDDLILTSTDGNYKF